MSITLAQIERETARKVGPFYVMPTDRQIPTTSGLDRAFVPALRSTVEQDLVTNLFVLRRGVDFQGAPVLVSLPDRQRTVANYDPERGMVEVDRPWALLPAPGEILEFHHLDPSQELRPAVLAGLRRTFFEDRYSLGGGYIYEADLTAALPWLTNPRAVWGLELAPLGHIGGTPKQIPHVAFGQAGHVIVRVQTGPSPFVGGVHVVVAHSHFNFVNGADSLTGPTEDNDLLEVDLDYATAAAHIEAWHNVPAKLQAAAAGNLQASQKDAALEFSRQSRIHAPRRPDNMQLQSLFGAGSNSVVVNA